MPACWAPAPAPRAGAAPGAPCGGHAVCSAPCARRLWQGLALGGSCRICVRCAPGASSRARAWPCMQDSVANKLTSGHLTHTPQLQIQGQQSTRRMRLLCAALLALVAVPASALTLDEPSGGWTTCPAAVTNVASNILGWRGMKDANSNCQMSDPASCTSFEASNQATSTHDFMVYVEAGPQVSLVFFSYNVKGLGISCTTDADCTAFCGHFKCSSSMCARGDEATAAASACYGNHTTMKGMTAAKFLELCSPAAPTALTTCPEGIKSELSHIPYWGPNSECSDGSGRGPTVDGGGTNPDFSYQFAYPSCNTHTVVMTKYKKGLFQTCTADADCTKICTDSACEPHLSLTDRQCKPKGWHKLGRIGNCGTSTTYAGISYEKLKELCPASDSDGASGSSGSSKSDGASGASGLRTGGTIVTTVVFTHIVALFASVW